MTKESRITLFFLGLAILASCSSDLKVTELDKSADPQVELDRVRKSISQAEEKQVNILSPKNFSAAKEHLDIAVKKREKNDKQINVLHEISVSNAYLEKANVSSGVSRQILPGSIEARKLATDSQAFQFFPKEMEQVDKKFRNLNEEIEENDTKGAALQGPIFETEYREIELRSIQKSSLGPAQASVQQAIKEGAVKLTPDTLAWTQKQISIEEAAIAQDRHNQAVVRRASIQSSAAAARLVKMVRDAKSSTVKKPEDFAKQNEKMEIANENSENQLDKAQGDLEKSKEQLESANRSNNKLRSQAWLDREYDSAFNTFSKDEAEVYRQGDKLLLRLKGLSFQNNRSGISSDNFQILAKVQKIINSNQSSLIVIEGHTDSTGGKKANENLSVRRAKSVQDYLIANKDIAQDKISFTGLGDTKPIASNKTAIGRSQNRRVDIIISSEAVVQ